MAKFNMDRHRTKLELQELSDLMIWLQFLYLSPENFLEIQGQTLKMDADFNLIWVMERRQPNGSYKEDFDSSICANTLCYKDLLTITENLKKDVKLWKDIEMSVLSSKVINSI